MSPASTKLCLIDPLTLKGRELLLLSSDVAGSLLEWTCLHTQSDDEHLIADIQGKASLVPAIEAPEDLAEHSLIVVASDTPSARLEHVSEFVESCPETALIDMSRLPLFQELTQVWTGSVKGQSHPLRVRVAHPALEAAHHLVNRFAHLEPQCITGAVIDPVSELGTATITTVAGQATQRLQGAEVTELVEHRILAFNHTLEHGAELTEEASALFPGLSVAFSRALSGCFHGHLVTLGLTFAEPIDDSEVWSILEQDPLLCLIEPPFGLESVINSDQVALAPPEIAADGRCLSVTALLDGLRLGGARTTLNILTQLLR